MVVENNDRETIDEQEHTTIDEEATTETTANEEAVVESEDEKKYKELEDRYLRLQADYTNFRRRSTEEKARMHAMGMEKLTLDILPVLDNFERALMVDDVQDEKFYKGMEMIADQFRSELAKNDIVEIDALNQTFDPNLHHAVVMEEKEGVDENTVTDVLQKGYRLGDRVIRPSMVKVSK